MKYTFTGQQVVKAFFNAARRCTLDGGNEDSGIIIALQASPEGREFIDQFSEDQLIGLVQGIIVGLDLAAGVK